MSERVGAEQTPDIEAILREHQLAGASIWTAECSCGQQEGVDYYAHLAAVLAAGLVRPEDVAEAQATRDLTDEEVADALLSAEALCRVRHPNRWSTVVEQRVTCLPCKETAIREARAAALRPVDAPEGGEGR